MKLLSIVIPVYNTGDKLNILLDSLCQHIQDSIEIIVVDDGSSNPNTLEILDKYSQLIQVIHTVNKGVSSARNTGIANSSGKYVCFWDSDDELKMNGLNRIIEYLEMDYDFYSFNYFLDSNLKKVTKKDMDASKEFALSTLFCSKEYNGYVWNKIMKRDILMENGISFDTDIYYNEDRLFVLRAILASSKIHFAEYAYYNYIMNSLGAMANSQEINAKTITEFTAFERCLNLVDDHRIKDLISTDAVYRTLDISIDKKKRKAIQPYMIKFYQKIHKKCLKLRLKHGFRYLYYFWKKW